VPRARRIQGDENAKAVFGRAEEKRGANQHGKDRDEESEVAPAFIEDQPQAEAGEGEDYRLFKGPGEIEQEAYVGKAEPRLGLAHYDQEGNHHQSGGGHIWANSERPILDERSAEPEAHGERERESAGCAAQF
jgi:hypothetical protein